jgi:hypothetical protein
VGLPARPDWYVLLCPSLEARDDLVARLRPLAALLGGEVAPNPHVTIGYFVGTATPEQVIAPLRALTGPPPVLHAAELFNFSAAHHPVFGHPLSVRVARSEALRSWYQSVCAALQPIGLRPLHTWEEARPHIQVLRHLPAPGQDLLAQLDDPSWPISFTATRLLMSRRVGDGFETLFERALDGRSHPDQRPGIKV